MTKLSARIAFALTRRYCRFVEARTARRIAKAERLQTKTRELLDKVSELEALIA